jgi:hypothetical protein
MMIARSPAITSTKPPNTTPMPSGRFRPFRSSQRTAGSRPRATKSAAATYMMMVLS